MNIKFDVNMPRFENVKSSSIEKAKKVLFLSMNKMEELAKKRCPVDTGILRRSINLSPKVPGSSTYILSDGVEYGYLVEFGTARMINAHGKHDPENPVTDWEAKRKRSAVGQTLPFMRPAKLEVERIWLPRFIKQVMKD